MSSVTSIALGGLQKAAESISKNAEKISTSAEIGDPEPFIEIKQAELAFKANAKVIQVDKELGDYLLDMFA